MADVQFVDNYVKLQRGMGNATIFAWKTPAGEVYYGAQPRSETTVDTTRVKRVSQKADTTVQPQTTTTTGAVQEAVAPIVPKADGGGGGRPGLRTSTGDFGGWFSSTGPRTPEEIIADKAEYDAYQAAVKGIKEDLETPLGKAASIATPLGTAVVEAFRHPEAVTKFFSSKGTEARAAEDLKTFEATTRDIPEEASDEDFWRSQEAAMDAFDLATSGEFSGQGISTAGTPDTIARAAVGLPANATSEELAAAQVVKAQADAKAKAQREQTARLRKEEASDSGYGRGGREGKAGGGTKGVAGGGTGGYGSPF